jgi:hypothetical protein
MSVYESSETFFERVLKQRAAAYDQLFEMQEASNKRVLAMLKNGLGLERKKAPVQDAVGAFGHLPVLEQHRMQQRGGEY